MIQPTIQPSVSEPIYNVVLIVTSNLVKQSNICKKEQKNSPHVYIYADSNICRGYKPWIKPQPQLKGLKRKKHVMFISKYRSCTKINIDKIYFRLINVPIIIAYNLYSKTLNMQII